MSKLVHSKFSSCKLQSGVVIDSRALRELLHLLGGYHASLAVHCCSLTKTAESVQDLPQYSLNYSDQVRSYPGVVCECLCKVNV